MLDPMRRAIRCAVVAMVLCAAPATAQPEPPAVAEPRRLELSAFIGIDYFGDDIELGNSWASEQKPGTAVVVGGRLTFIALPALVGGRTHLDLGVEIEAKLAAASTGGSFDGGRGSYFAPVIGWRGHLIARIDGVTASLAPHVVVGGGGETVASTSPYMMDETDALFYYGAGLTWSVSRRWGVRLDGRHGLTAGREHEITSTLEVLIGASARWDLADRGPPPPPPDADGDGIDDDDDRCPAEPETANELEDSDGCPDSPDQDGDGLADAADRCPFDPEDANGIDDADGCPDKDEDADGVIGSSDACPIDPEDRDAFEDTDGCPDVDNDADGVADALDTCPLEAEVWNGITDEDGCPDELPEKVKAFEGVMAGVNFQNNKAKILASSKKVLARTVAVLREFPGLRVRIEGHTDSTGAREKNLALSRRRAEAVKWYLVDQGIAADRLETEGVGPDRPIADEATKSGRARNRRIEFHLLPTSKPGTAPAPATQPTAPATQPTAPATQPSATP
jgi:outer membrane protein OmpA-like peptidoglycan-associated protein